MATLGSGRRSKKPPPTNPFASVRKRVDHLRLRPCSTRSLAADPSDEFFQEEFIIHEGTILYNEVDALRATVIPLRQQCQEAEAKYRADEHKRLRDEDPEADQELGKLEFEQDGLRTQATALEEQLEDLREHFDPHAADDLAQFIADQRVMIQATEKRVCNLLAECDQVREAHRLLVECHMHDTIEDNDVKISELRDRLQKLELVEEVLDNDQRQSSEARNKAITLAREAIVLQRKLRAIEYVREQRQLDLQNIEQVHASQKKAIEAALVQNQAKRDEDTARGRWRDSFHTRMEQFRMSSAVYYAQREDEARADDDTSAERQPGRLSTQRVESVRLPTAELPPRSPRRRIEPRPVEGESRDRDGPAEPATDGAKLEGEERHDVPLEAGGSDVSTAAVAQGVVDEILLPDQQAAPLGEARRDPDTTTEPVENYEAGSASLSGGTQEATPEVVDEISKPAQHTAPETGDETKVSAASDHTTPAESPAFDGRDGGANELAEISRVVVDQLLESNEQDDTLSPNEERPAAQATDEAVPSEDSGDVNAVAAGEVTESNPPATSEHDRELGEHVSDQTAGAGATGHYDNHEPSAPVASGGFGDMIAVVADEIAHSSAPATPEHDREPEQLLSDERTVIVTTSGPDNDERSPAVASDSLGDVMLVTIDDIPPSNKGTDAAGGTGRGLGDLRLASVDDIRHSNEVTAADPQAGDLVAAQLPDDLIVASRAFVGAFLASEDVRDGGPQNEEVSRGGEAGQPTIADVLGEVVSVFAVNLLGSPRLPNGGESRGLEHESDILGHAVESELLPESPGALDEIHGPTETEIVADNKEAEDTVDHMAETDLSAAGDEPKLLAEFELITTTEEPQHAPSLELVSAGEEPEPTVDPEVIAGHQEDGADHLVVPDAAVGTDEADHPAAGVVIGDRGGPFEELIPHGDDAAAVLGFDDPGHVAGEAGAAVGDVDRAAAAAGNEEIDPLGDVPAKLVADEPACGRDLPIQSGALFGEIAGIAGAIARAFDGILTD